MEHVYHTSLPTVGLQESTPAIDSIDLADLTVVAREVVGGLADVIDRNTLAPDARRVYEIAQHIAGYYGAMPKGEREPHQRLGYLLALDALIVSPDAVHAALVRLRAQLVVADPALAIIAPMEVERA